jgi:hypothetical protein
MIARFTLIAALASTALGCHTGEAIDPVPTPDAGGPAPDDAGITPPVDAGRVKRTVFTRNPMGGPVGNLLADGDFELSTQSYPGSQVGVRGFSETGSGEVLIKTETGGVCKSGLRCALFESHTVLFFNGTSAGSEVGLALSVWVKPPPEQSCSVASISAVSCDTLVFLGSVPAPAQGADPDGWCQFKGTMSPQRSAVCVYMSNTLQGADRMLVDAATLVPDDGTFAPFQSSKATPELEARLTRLGEHLRRTRQFGKPARMQAKPAE